MCFLADKMQLQDSTPFSWRTLTTWDFNLTSKISALEARSNLSKELKVLNQSSFSLYKTLEVL